MKNIHVISTDKPSRLSKSTKSGLNAAKKGKGLYESGRFGITTFNIYITSDEEIKEGDWVYDNDANQIVSYKNLNVNPNLPNFPYYKKIILTTDQDLIKDGVQAIDDEFLEWFVKNPSCEFIKTYYNPLNKEYDFIIPKEESKPFKDMLPLTEVDLEDFKKNPVPTKKETLEEAAEWLNKKFNGKGVEVKIIDWGFNEKYNYPPTKLLEEYSKWQQKRSYSDEEVLKAQQAILSNIKDALQDENYIIDYLKQFKNK
jgi:hypothetical protein